MRRIFILIGAVLGIVVAIGIFLFLQLSRPEEVEVPVAANDIPAGTVLHAAAFNKVTLSGIDNKTISKWVTVPEWSRADGKVTNSDIHAGFPVAKTQIDPNTPAGLETRLSVVLSGTNDYYVVIPTGPNEVGMYLQPGDRVDLIISIGGGEGKGALTLLPLTTTVGGTGTGVGAGMVVSQVNAPISKLVMQNMNVLRVDRARPPAQAANAAPAPEANTLTDIQRIYVKVDRDQLEVLSFVLNNGKRNIAVRAYSGSQSSAPTDGVTWDDFVRWFMSQRPEGLDKVQPFDSTIPGR